MNLHLHATLTALPDEEAAVVVDLAGRGEVDPAVVDPSVVGALLKLVEPDLILTAARAARKFDAPWVLLRLDLLELSAARAAAFACKLAHAVRGDLHVVLAQETMRQQQIAGHLQRAIAQAARR